MKDTGNDSPEIREVKIGFMPLSDCAPIIIASEFGFDRKHGISLIPVRQTSWAAIRDNLINGEIHAAHALYGLIYGIHLGIAISSPTRMAVLMTLNRNGQAITLSTHLKNQGISDGISLAQWIKRSPVKLTFAQTYPTGTHAMWLYYWLAHHGIDPLKEVNMVSVPPSGMVAQMQQGVLDGFCVGEPWNSQALHDQVGFTVSTSQEIWPDHPEKVLGTTANFSRTYPNTTHALIMALIEASRYLDDMKNRVKSASLIAKPEYVDCPQEIVIPRFTGQLEGESGTLRKDPHPLKFFDEGRVSPPYFSDGMWFLTQFYRWGILHTLPDFDAITGEIQQFEIYRQAARNIQITTPPTGMRESRLMGGSVWDGSNPLAYINTFKK